MNPDSEKTAALEEHWQLTRVRIRRPGRVLNGPGISASENPAAFGPLFRRPTDDDRPPAANAQSASPENAPQP